MKEYLTLEKAEQIRSKSFLSLALFFLILYGIFAALILFAPSLCWFHATRLGERSLSEILSLVFIWFAIVSVYRLYDFKKERGYFFLFFAVALLFAEEIDWGQVLMVRRGLGLQTTDLSFHDRFGFLRENSVFEMGELIIYIGVPLILFVRLFISEIVTFFQVLLSLLPLAVRGLLAINGQFYSSPDSYDIQLAGFVARVQACSGEFYPELFELLLYMAILYHLMLELLAQFPQRVAAQRARAEALEEARRELEIEVHEDS